MPLSNPRRALHSAGLILENEIGRNRLVGPARCAQVSVNYRHGERRVNPKIDSIFGFLALVWFFA